MSQHESRQESAPTHRGPYPPQEFGDMKLRELKPGMPTRGGPRYPVVIAGVAVIAVGLLIGLAYYGFGA